MLKILVSQQLFERSKFDVKAKKHFCPKNRDDRNTGLK